ncbi:YlbE-like family protein [Mesobacillus maritimus]|uniref:YlbE-like family protein n=1 Tax=Mesobacillus maritimus TaxID=1643336 RepID=UPI00203B3A72|nr:YlbE-like family protein [Mesobacillus maritimus]MCM3587066.1 YlbE-like family protein [Mesobacillus maritimus]MCM3667631.1 YlbE-like family protein [Mesobacillus maritimus]
MRRDILEQIKKQKELHEFLRLNPNWYRRLARDPRELRTMEIAAMNFYGRTIPQQVQKFSNGVQMANMMFHMFANMNSSSS